MLETIAVITALIYVLLAAKERSLCFVFGLISSAIFIYISFQAKYYYDAFINGYYVVMSVYGLVHWKKSNNEPQVAINQLSSKLRLFYLIVGFIAVGLLGYIGVYYLQSDLPFLDAFTTVFALIATWMMVQKNIENWLVWIVVDAICIAMYAHKELYQTAGLFAVYTIIAVFGYLEWKKKMTASIALP